MGLFILLSAVLAVDATVVSQHDIQKRQTQSAGGFFDMIANMLKPKPVVAISPIQSAILTPELFPRAVREQFVFGPFPLKAANADHTGGAGIKLDAKSDMITATLQNFCKNCMVLRANAQITDNVGKPLDLTSEVYTHHILISELGKTAPMAPLKQPPFPKNCPTTSLAGMSGMLNGLSGFSLGTKSGSGSMSGVHSHGRRAPQLGGGNLSGKSRGLSMFIAKGNEGDTSVYSALNDTVVKSGYWIAEGSQMSASAEVVNYRNNSREVYMTVDIEYLKGFNTRPKEYLEVGFGTIIVLSCDGANLVPPKDKMVTYTSDDWASTGNGYIIGFSPHLHDGAVNLKLLVNGKVMCSSEAVYGQDGGTTVNGQKWETIISYTPCLDPINVRIGDKVKVVSDYDLTKHRLRPISSGNMGEAEAMVVGAYHFAKEP